MQSILKLLRINKLATMHDTHEVGSSNLPSPTTLNNILPVNGLGSKITLYDACSQYELACSQRNLRPQSIVTMKQRIRSYIKWTKCNYVHEVTRQDVKNFAESFPGRWSRVGHRNDVCVFLNWCGQMGFIEEGKFYKVKILDVLQDENPIDVLSVEQANRLMNVLPDRFKARAALQLFTGVRPYESVKIQSNDLDFQGKTLTIQGRYSKLRRMRMLHELPDNLLAWLEKYPLTETTYNAFRLARRRYFGAMAHDAMRHTFCTYAYFEMGMEKTMRYTGHSNYKTFHRHYCESSVNPEDSKNFFKIMPRP